jgi:hypothetical protein
LKRLSTNRRHDSCQNGLARFARSNTCIVQTTPKTSRSLVPDGRISLLRGNVMFDVSGIYPLAPSFRSQVAGVQGHAVEQREAYKRGKYNAYAISQGCEFLAFGVEAFGGLGESAKKLMRWIADEGEAVGASQYRTSFAEFRSWLSVDWQRHNARIYREWRKLCHSA